MSSNNKLKIKSPSKGRARASSWSDSSALSTCRRACASLCQLPRGFFEKQWSIHRGTKMGKQ